MGQINVQPPSPYYGDNSSTGTLYNDIWGYATGSREYALQTGDFQAAATALQAASLGNAANNLDWSEGSLNAAGLAAFNKTGTTQLRIYFALDDNNNTRSTTTSDTTPATTRRRPTARSLS